MAGTLAMFTAVFCHFCQHLQENAGLMPHHVTSFSLQFIIVPFIAVTTSLNNHEKATLYTVLPFSAEVKERTELFLYSSPWAFVAYSRVNINFTL
jgi:hypothetical protein